MRYLLVCVAAICLGCGGSGGGGGSSNSFAGDWNAPNPRVVPPPGDSGTLAFTLSGNQVSGNLFNAGKGETGVLSGTFVNGRLTATVDFPTSLDWTIEGNLDSSMDGVVIVSTEEYNRTVHSYLMRVTLDPQ